VLFQSIAGESPTTGEGRAAASQGGIDMKQLSIVLVIAMTSIVACAPEQPYSGGKAHQGGEVTTVAQPLDATDPHAVQRDATVSAYCLGCHPLDPANNHPWSVSLADAAAAHPGQYFGAPADPAVVLVNGSMVECTSCHDDGSAGFPRKTVLATGLCDACHDKGDSSSPSVAITSPGPGVTVQGTIAVDATASDDRGVVRAELWVVAASGSRSLVSSVVPSGLTVSFALDTAALPDGLTTLEVRAYDAAGNVGTGTTAVTIDDTPPAAAIASPIAGANVRGTTSVVATASDAAGIAAVDFYVDGVLLARATAEPYVAQWTPARRSGWHALTVVATDVSGNSATSAPVAVLAK
jgi:hypothetical protein